jgi:hypothetical protein
LLFSVSVFCFAGGRELLAQGAAKKKKENPPPPYLGALR